MAFEPKKYDSGQTLSLKQAASSTVTKYDGLDTSSGYVQRATSATTFVPFVSLEDNVNAAATYTEILCVRTDGVLFECDTAGATSQALVGTFLDLTDHDTINQAASTTNVLFVTGLVGATTDNKVEGYFMQNVA